MHHDAVVRYLESHHRVARYRVAAVGQHVLDLFVVVVQKEGVRGHVQLLLDELVQRLALDFLRHLLLEIGQLFGVLHRQQLGDLALGQLLGGHAAPETLGTLLQRGFHHLADVLFGEFHAKFVEVLLELELSGGDELLLLVAEEVLDAAAGLRGLHELQPFRLRKLLLGGDDFHLVAVVEGLVDGGDVVVDFRADAVVSEVGVQSVGEVKHGGTLRKCLHVALGGEDVDLFQTEVETHLAEEVQGVGIFAVEDLAGAQQPVLQALVHVRVGAFSVVLVVVVRGETFFGNLVHPFGADLHLHPAALLAHGSDMQRLVAVGLGVGEEVAVARGVGPVEVADDVVDAPADVELLVHGAVEHETHGENVIDVLEVDLLADHLVVDGRHGLGAAGDLGFDAGLVERFLDRGDELGNHRGTFLLGILEFLGDGEILRGVGVAHGVVLQFALDGVEAEAVGEGDVEVRGLGGDFELLFRRHRVEGAHIVQPVGELDEDHAHILRHGEEDLLEVLGLQGDVLVIHHKVVDFGESVDDVGHHVAEKLAHVVEGVVGVLHHVMQQGADDGGGAEVHLGAADHGHGDRVVDVGLAALAPHAVVRVGGQLECLADLFALLRVGPRPYHLQQLAVLSHHGLVL